MRHTLPIIERDFYPRVDARPCNHFLKKISHLGYYSLYVLYPLWWERFISISFWIETLFCPGSDIISSLADGFSRRTFTGIIDPRTFQLPINTYRNRALRSKRREEPSWQISIVFTVVIPSRVPQRWAWPRKSDTFVPFQQVLWGEVSFVYLPAPIGQSACNGQHRPNLRAINLLKCRLTKICLLFDKENYRTLRINEKFRFLSTTFLLFKIER